VRILLDESLPRPLAKSPTGHEVRAVTELGWTGIKNGDLLTKATGTFDTLLTADQNIEFQQNLVKLPIAVVVLVAASVNQPQVRSKLLARKSRIVPVDAGLAPPHELAADGFEVTAGHLDHLLSDRCTPLVGCNGLLIGEYRKRQRGFLKSSWRTCSRKRRTVGAVTVMSVYL
jgi:hypothetical protein